LWMGPRHMEVVGRLVRDIDDRGRRLRIPEAKTKMGQRTLLIPLDLQGPLNRQVADRNPLDRIFTRGKSHTWMQKNMTKLCEAAGVPRVTMQGLRGTYASISAELGDSESSIASRLGHANFGVTKGHYVREGAIQAAAGTRVAARLGRGVDVLEAPPTLAKKAAGDRYPLRRPPSPKGRPKR